MEIEMTDQTTRLPIRRALISVSDKTGILEFARELQPRRRDPVHRRHLQAAQGQRRAAVEVADYTGFAEMMDGRVKTLHPKIHGGILGRRGTDDAIMNEHGIKPIDLVAVNLYPFEATIAKPGCDLPTAIENIDIGGPTMVRSAAKNHKDVAIVVNASDYAGIVEGLKAGGLTYAQRFDLMLKAFEHTAAYDGMIANYMGTMTRPDTRAPAAANSRAPSTASSSRPRKCATARTRTRARRSTRSQGRSRHRHRHPAARQGTVLQQRGRHRRRAGMREELRQAGLRHRQARQPVRRGRGPDAEGGIRKAYDLAYATDTESAFGGIIAFNRELDGETAKAIVDRQFVEVIIAPRPEAARDVVAAKERTPAGVRRVVGRRAAWDFKRVNGGLLVQSRDIGMITADDLKSSPSAPRPSKKSTTWFAWKVAKFVKSNAIVYAKQRQTIGVGAGQMSRVNSARIAAIKAEHAGLQVQGAVMASDAFFPFRDGIDNAAKAGISAVIQPGGSMRDAEVIAAADEAGIAMVFTGMRHFRH
jgi:phosphoribosylaminoimidazolecarboxamide formyltransferase/IMP cyclohydrolase